MSNALGGQGNSRNKRVQDEARCMLSLCEAKLVYGKHGTGGCSYGSGCEGITRFICGLVYYSCMRRIEL